MSTKTDHISCPTCNKPGTWNPENKFRPFCSERCKMIDLGAWASEDHKIPGEPVDPNDLPENDAKDPDRL